MLLKIAINKMNYQIRITKAVERDIKKLDLQVKQALKEHLLALSKNPNLGRLLSGRFGYLWSYHFSFNKVEYRIIYEIIKDEIVISILLVGTRENIYKQLMRRLK